MANIIRTSKSGSNWTENELKAYNIIIKNVEEKTFFGEEPNTLPNNIGKEFLDFSFEDEGIEEKDDLLMYLDMAMKEQESSVDDFTRELFINIGYKTKSRIIKVRKSLNFLICANETYAQTDVCILRKKGELLLLMQEDKRLTNFKDPEPQVIAEAIAAFQENNRIRHEDGLKKLDLMTIPCITMIGTYPTFYLISVSKELSNCIMTGQYPKTKTIILKFIPSISRRSSDGMKPKKDRWKILQCFEAFKKFVDELEQLLHEV